jgi:hypothetical protein
MSSLHVLKLHACSRTRAPKTSTKPHLRHRLMSILPHGPSLARGHFHLHSINPNSSVVPPPELLDPVVLFPRSLSPAPERACMPTRPPAQGPPPPLRSCRARELRPLFCIPTAATKTAPSLTSLPPCVRMCMFPPTNLHAAAAVCAQACRPATKKAPSGSRPSPSVGTTT